MDGLSVLSQSSDAPFYTIGNAHGWLSKSSKTAGAEYHLSGRLYLAKSGWLLLSVPNALVRGVFDAMSHAGAELPLAGTLNVPNVDKELLNAHISVMTADEVEAIGANKINERGHSFKYALGHVKELTPNNIDGVSKLWAIQISSPELSALRKSYGLSALPKDEPFHITVAVRRKNVLRENAVSKFDTASGRGELKAAADNTPIDFDKWHGKAFKIVTTPPGQSVASHTDSTPIADEPGRVSIVTPENGASWNWPAAPQETINNFRQNWSSIQGGIGGYKMDQIRRGMGATQIGQPPPATPAAPASLQQPAPSPAQPIGKVAAAETTYDCNCSGRCTCPPNCMCKKSCCAPEKSANEGAPWGTPADKLPWRERVEVYAHDPKGRIYGGIYNTDKSFAVPGGGIDPGEDPGQAALRELEEETGIKATNPRVLPIAPVDNAWSDKHRQEKQRNFAGSRTHFVAVDILKKLRRKNLDKWDAAQRKMYDPTAAEQMMANHKTFMAPSVAAGRLAALRHIIANAAKKTAADLLPGGAADNVPDSKFPKTDLALGVKDEREHTSNDQVAKEIAKDHLQKDPGYYKKEKLSEKAAMPAIIRKLREAKEHSDNKRYAQKNQILKTLMSEAPHEWVVDDPEPYHMGITHAPTKFKFHADPLIIPTVVPVRAKAASNPYLKHLTQTPITYDQNQSLLNNVMRHVRKVKDRGANQVALDNNTESWRDTLIPGHREQKYLAIARGQYPKQDFMTQLIHERGDGVLNALSKNV
jgi:ADP-ribose pyrophosphatase YjhB (NUDIX family)